MSNVLVCDRLARHGDRPAIVCADARASYADLAAMVEAYRATLRESGVAAGACVAVPATHTPRAVALLLTAIAEGLIAVPMSASNPAVTEVRLALARASHVAELDDDGRLCLFDGPGGDHELLTRLRERGEPGLILFSSGSTGSPKAALLSARRLLSRYQTRGAAMRTLVFMSFDHIGGVNTLLYTLCNGGLAVVPSERTPDAVCRAMHEHAVELLPTTPTFLNVMLMSGVLTRHALTELRLITYGTECMPQSTLTALHRALPNVKLKQTYGSTELGILRTRSEHSASLWFEIASLDYEVRSVDGVAEIRSRQRMEGYLNAPQPFDEHGWCRTGDVVEHKGGYLRVVGRASEIINVGGEKVVPVDVENVLLQLDNVAEVVVEGRRNRVTGQIVTARVRLVEPEDPEQFEDRLRAFCAPRLAEFQIPLLIEITGAALSTRRFKRARSGGDEP